MLRYGNRVSTNVAIAQPTIRDVPKIEPAELVDSDEVARLLGLTSRNAVRVYRGRYEDFPQPVVKKGRCLLWIRADVERWAKARRG